MIFRDTGCGISDQNKEMRVKNFSKLEDSTKVNKQGVGLGLSICREIINANSGSIVIESDLGKGTDFVISLIAKCVLDEDNSQNDDKSR